MQRRHKVSAAVQQNQRNGNSDLGMEWAETTNDEAEKLALNLGDLGRRPANGLEARGRSSGKQCEQNCYVDDEGQPVVKKSGRKLNHTLEPQRERASPKLRPPNQIVSKSQSRNVAHTLQEVNSMSVRSAINQNNARG